MLQSRDGKTLVHAKVAVAAGGPHPRRQPQPRPAARHVDADRRSLRAGQAARNLAAERLRCEPDEVDVEPVIDKVIRR